MALESSQKELQDCFRPHPIRGLSKKLWMPKIPGVQPGTVSRFLLESPGKKCHWNGSRRVTHRILYGRRWWLPPRTGRGESSESKVACGLSQHQKGAE